MAGSVPFLASCFVLLEFSGAGICMRMGRNSMMESQLRGREFMGIAALPALHLMGFGSCT
jgi:hypothetical protein